MANKFTKALFYYLGIDRAEARFDEGVSAETRHTFGIRFWANGNGLVHSF